MTNDEIYGIIYNVKIKKREVNKMRGLFYSVIEMNTKKKFSVGLSREKAVQKMIELAKENPKGDYRIAYKWGSI